MIEKNSKGFVWFTVHILVSKLDKQECILQLVNPSSKLLNVITHEEKNNQRSSWLILYLNYVFGIR